MGWGSKPATKFHTLEKAVLERDKNTNMRRQNRYILYIISFMAVLSLVLAGMRLVHPERIGNGRSGEQTESKLKGQSGETDQNTGMVENQNIRVVEHLVSDRTAGDADDELQDEGGDGIARVTGQDVGQSQTDGAGQTSCW